MNDNATQPYQYHWMWGTLFALITLITVALRYALPIRDGDIWWHMLYGKYFLQHHTLIADHTIFSWTPSTNDTIYCTWLPDIFLYLTHKYCGLPGLFVFRYFCLFIFILACFLFARKLKGVTHPLVWFITLVTILMAYTAVFIKPEIISFVLITILAWNWWNIRAGGNKIQYWCYAFPLIMLIWVNSHGAFVFGYIFLIAVTFGEIMNTWWSYNNALPKNIRKHLWIAIGLSLLVVFINPYGWHYPLQLFFDLLPTKDNLNYNSKIVAYTSTFAFKADFHNFSLFVNIAIAFTIGLLILQLKQRKTEWSSLISIITFTFIYSQYLRTTFYLAPVIVFPAIYMLLTTDVKLSVKSNKKLHIFLPPIVLFFMLYLAIYTVHSGFTNPENDVLAGNFNISGNNPVDEADYIKKNFPDAHIGNSYNFGAYLLWTLWPDNKVFFDSRHFPYKQWSDEFFNARSTRGLDQLLSKYPCDLWVFDHSETYLSSYFRYSPDWKLAYYGRTGQVFVTKNTPLPGDGHYQVSNKIDTIQSRHAIYRVFLFTLSIYDWKTAELIARKEEDRFNKLNKPNSASLYEHLLTGMKAFTEGDYSLALVKLGKLSDLVQGAGGYVVMSHLHLAQEAIDDKQIALANAHTQTALELLPGAFYTQYDAGFTRWLIYNATTSPEKSEHDKESYERNFREFIRLVQGNEKLFQEEISFAHKILEGESPDMTHIHNLLVPNLKGLAD